MSHDLIGLDELADVLRERQGPAEPVRRGARQRHGRALVVGVLSAAIAGGAVAAIVAVRGDEHEGSRAGGSAAGSCAAAVEWRGTRYIGHPPQVPLTLGRALGDATIPPCGGTDGGSVTPGRSTAVVAVEGVSPEQAIALAGDPSRVYVGAGRLPEVPHTPLRNLIYGADASRPNERSECEPGHTTTAEVRARVRVGWGAGLRVTLLEPTSLPHENWIFPDAQTVVSGGGSPPRLEPGDVVRAEVLVCRHADDPHFLKLVATRLDLGP